MTDWKSMHDCLPSLSVPVVCQGVDNLLRVVVRCPSVRRRLVWRHSDTNEMLDCVALMWCHLPVCGWRLGEPVVSELRILMDMGSYCVVGAHSPKGCFFDVSRVGRIWSDLPLRYQPLLPAPGWYRGANGGTIIYV